MSFSSKASHPFTVSSAHKHARVYIWACVQNTEDLLCVIEQVRIYVVFLHLVLRSASGKKLEVFKPRQIAVHTWYYRASQMLVSHQTISH